MDIDQVENHISQISKSIQSEKIKQLGYHHNLWIDEQVCTGLFIENNSEYEQNLSYLEYLFVFLIREYNEVYGNINPKIDITPQYRLNKYRIDFHLKTCNECFVELDGFAYHDRNKEQFKKERQRQNEIILTGIPLLRFTFDDVTKEPMRIINQITEIIG